MYVAQARVEEIREMTKHVHGKIDVAVRILEQSADPVLVDHVIELLRSARSLTDLVEDFEEPLPPVIQAFPEDRDDSTVDLLASREHAMRNKLIRFR